MELEIPVVKLYSGELCGRQRSKQHHTSMPSLALQSLSPSLRIHHHQHWSKGTSMYDVCSGWGEGGPQKEDERNKVA